jgi:uncharacterized protein (TIGR02118 family)
MTIRISALYPNHPGSRFDADYYIARHEPFARDLLADHGLVAVHTMIGLAAMDGGSPPFWAISEMVFTSRAAFDAAMAACGAALVADIPNYTDATPVLQISIPGQDFAHSRGS